jgi:hypothetical protein
MFFKNRRFLLFALPLLLCISCLYSRTSSQTSAVKKTIMINFGTAILKINGQINENLYSYDPDKRLKDPVNYYDNPLINEGTITKDETKNISAGETYTFSVLPAEVVTINIVSLDENDVEISVSEYGREKKHILKGTNRLGLTLAFQNK